MNYLDLLKASKGRDNIPTIEKMRWRKVEKQRAGKGVCIKCGQFRAGVNSFLCLACEAAYTREMVQKEIDMARKRILGSGGA